MGVSMAGMVSLCVTVHLMLLQDLRAENEIVLATDDIVAR